MKSQMGLFKNLFGGKSHSRLKDMSSLSPQKRNEAVSDSAAGLGQIRAIIQTVEPFSDALVNSVNIRSLKTPIGHWLWARVLRGAVFFVAEAIGASHSDASLAHAMALQSIGDKYPLVEPGADEAHLLFAMKANTEDPEFAEQLVSLGKAEMMTFSRCRETGKAYSAEHFRALIDDFIKEFG
jgi:hypothetical protein